MKFNTAIAALMALVNQFSDNAPTRGDIKAMLLMLSPFAPHIAEELWEIQGFSGQCCLHAWPKYDESKLVDSEKEIAVQVGGKLKSTIIVPVDADNDAVLAIAYANEKIAKLMEGMEVVKAIVVRKGDEIKLVNLILKPKK
jgi:leucyl-tRNA synthetase